MKRLAALSVAALSSLLVSCGDDNAVAATATKGDAFCKLAEAAKADGDALDALDDTDLADKVKVKVALSSAVDSSSAAVAKAPKDIAETAKELLSKQEEIEKLLAKYDYDFTKFAASEDAKNFDNDAAQKVSDDFDAYLVDKCGLAPDDTTPDTTPVETAAPTDTASGSAIDLGEGDEAINKFLDLYEIGTSTTLTADQRSCVVSELSGKVTGAELTDAMNSEPSAELQQTIGLAFINCNVAVQS